MTKQELIKQLKKEAQKATAKVIQMTFDSNLRNMRFVEIQNILNSKIKEVNQL